MRTAMLFYDSAKVVNALWTWRSVHPVAFAGSQIGVKAHLVDVVKDRYPDERMPGSFAAIVAQ